MPKITENKIYKGEEAHRIANNIKLIRHALRKSQEDVALQLNLSQNRISQYELGEIEFDANIVTKFAEALKVPAEFLVNYDLLNTAQKYVHIEGENILESNSGTGVAGTVNNNFPLEQVKEIVTMITSEKDKLIERLEKIIAEQKEELTKLRKK